MFTSLSELLLLLQRKLLQDQYQPVLLAAHTSRNVLVDCSTGTTGHADLLSVSD
jgi:phenylacetate-coenzyme A ligase PaaK-like adenylate-forming protein